MPRVHVVSDPATFRFGDYENRMTLDSSQRRILHFLDYPTELAHAGDNARLLGILAPVGKECVRFKIVLHIGSVGLGLEDVKGHSHVPANDLARRINE
jgi:hypothetical protein